MKTYGFEKYLILLVLLASACSKPDRPENLLLITIDTLRADHLGCYGYSDAKTPVIDRLADQGTLFERAYACAPTTLPSHAGILTGLYPPSTGIRDNGLFRLPSSIVTVTEVLHDHGFTTGAVLAADPLNQRFGLDQGFDFYDAPGVQSHNYSVRNAGEITSRAVSWLEGADKDKPFFLWVHYFDPHAPYTPPEPFVGGTPVEQYDGEIAYTDQQIGALLQALEAQGNRDATLVILTADHGESLGEHGESGHSVFIYDATIHVPVIVSGPGIPRGKRIDRVVSNIDIPYTACSLLKAGSMPDWTNSLPRQVAPGDLFQDRGPRVVYSESMVPAIRYGWSGLTSIRTEDWLYIKAPREELYRLDDSDWGQVRNRIDSKAVSDASLRKLLDEMVQKMPQPEAPQSSLADALSEEERRSMEQLGYLLAGAETSNPFEGELADPKDKIEISERIYEAVQAIGQGRLKKAMKQLQWVRENDADNVLSLMLLGDLFEKMDDMEEARDSYLKVLELSPNYWKAFSELASLEVRMGRLDDAEGHLKKALEIASFSAELWCKWGQMLEAQGKTFEAADAYHQVLDMDEKNRFARKALQRMDKE
ncbi:MAG: sulfatase-like hydrolase/transferase [Planctomycetota bacterium]